MQVQIKICFIGIIVSIKTINVNRIICYNTKMKKVYFWQRCIDCNAKLLPDKFYYTCPKCGSLLLVERDEEYIDKIVGKGKKAQAFFDAIRFGKGRNEYPNGSGVFMWLPHILPGFPKEMAVSLQEGFTDLFEIPDWLKKKVGMQHLYIKMEGQLPSESFKDRGMSVAISEALRLQKYYPNLKIRSVACASTGDTSAAAAIYSAYVKDRLNCIVFLPHENISEEQLFQAMSHGALVLSIKHKKGFDGCMELISQYCQKHKELVLLNSKNAFRVAGQETISLEICQDLSWKAPNWISVPCGNGGNLTALLISLLRMKERGMIEKLPGIIVAQTKNANTLVRWAKSNFRDFTPGAFKDSVASAMNIQNPVSFPRIKKCINNFDVHYFDVEEEQIQKTRALFMSSGANICPQSAVALDGILQARAKNIIKEKDTVVSISTASGVKFAKSGLSYHMEQKRNGFSNPYHTVSGNIDSVEEAIAMFGPSSKNPRK